VLIGLTDDAYDGESPDEPRVTADEERFLLETISLALDRPLTREDVVGRYAGLRPLLDSGRGGSTADLSRRHALIEDPGSGAVTVVGGKLTTYRQMAQDAVDRVAARPGVAAGPCRTAMVPLVGAPARAMQPPRGVPPRLWRRFGAEALELMAMAEDRPEWLQPVAPGIPALGIEAVVAIQREGALTDDDVLDRRLRLGLVPAWYDAARDAAKPIVEYAGGASQGAPGSALPTIVGR
jgi:glycerol-3-phosphate dehydrogenase